MFVSIIHLRIKYFIVFVFYLWYLFVASAFVRMVIFFYFLTSMVRSSLLSEHNLLVWFYTPLICAMIESALPEQVFLTKLYVKACSYYFLLIGVWFIPLRGDCS